MDSEDSIPSLEKLYLNLIVELKLKESLRYTVEQALYESQREFERYSRAVFEYVDS